MAKEPKNGQLTNQKTINIKCIKVHGLKEKCKEWVNWFWVRTRFMLVNLLMDILVVTVLENGLTVIYMKVILKMAFKMDKVHFFVNKVDGHTLANGKKARWPRLEVVIGLMELNIVANGETVLRKDRVCWIIVMGRFIKVNLRMTFQMAKDKKILLMEVFILDLSWMDSFMVGANINSLICIKSMMECGSKMKLRERG